MLASNGGADIAGTRVKAASDDESYRVKLLFLFEILPVIRPSKVLHIHGIESLRALWC